MGRDSRGDRYGRRDDVVDPHGGSRGGGEASSSRYSRYARTKRSRSPRGGRRNSSEERKHRRHRSESVSRQRRRREVSGDSGKKGHRRSRSRSRSKPSSRRKEGGELSRFKTVDVNELLQSPTPDPSAVPGNSLQTQILFQLLQQQQQQHAGLLSDPLPAAVAIPPVETTPMISVGTVAGAVQSAYPLQTDGEVPQETLIDQPAPAKVLPSVADFVPVIPKSLVGLLTTPATGSNVESGGADVSAASGGGANGGTCGVLTTATGALAVLQAPKLSPEAERRAREARRAHISCFPRGTTQQELLDYFRTIIPIVRRIRVQREMDRLTEEARAKLGNDAEAENIERREIPANAVIDVDRVIDLAVNSAKSKPFGFLEVSLADLVTELVEESVRDPDRFTFVAADGKPYPITIRRPRDYQELPGVDHRKVVMLGFPPTLPLEKLRLVFEQFGQLLAFDVKEGMAYGEFEKEEDAVECVRDLQGEVLGNRVVVLMPLYDWLKVVCTHADIDVSLDPDDPVAGTSLLAKTSQNDGAIVPLLAEDVEKKEEPVDHMKELLELTVHLPDVILHFSKTFPHLRSLYGSTVPIFPTRILVLMNLFDEEELVLDETYERLVEEVSEEVEKHGRVKSLIIPRRTPPPLPPKLPKNVLASRTGATKNSEMGQPKYSQNDDSEGSRKDYEFAADPTAPPMPSNISVGREDVQSFRGDNDGIKHDQGDGSNLNTNNDSINDDEDEEAKYEREKAEYLKAREAYTENILHPIHGGLGRVFVEYESVDEAAIAQREIAGRLFGGRTVVTSFMFEDVLYPPTTEEEEARAEEKVQLYLESIGAGDGDEGENVGNGEAQPHGGTEEGTQTGAFEESQNLPLKTEGDDGIAGIDG
ncbi:RBSR4 [Trypanosoma brucei gambiense DAL972]|uniref:RNA-binding protein, putative n=1 Tax=Trypanosoma brucei gambiense (strain MHOM/CI/86/DAL972) TaxID=679716 RepID=D0A257_TRYB9|nr:RBSR4 [Trypanosoma brucei gambiense DAL972]CBH15351.1 RBSR4 [Trypanosoma brucei gambiense DAL972]|eukprot:XP_011777615.1 RBSR4 [Trypanosoma brucei gambiense DAL972]